MYPLSTLANALCNGKQCCGERARRRIAPCGKVQGPDDNGLSDHSLVVRSVATREHPQMLVGCLGRMHAPRDCAQRPVDGIANHNFPGVTGLQDMKTGIAVKCNAVCCNSEGDDSCLPTIARRSHTYWSGVSTRCIRKRKLIGNPSCA